MDSHVYFKFNCIFKTLFPNKDHNSILTHNESRFISLFKELNKQSHFSPSYSMKTSDRSPSPSSPITPRSPSNHTWSLNLKRIALKEDTRTTLMIKNIPNKFSREKLLSIIDEKFKDCYDLYVLPTDSVGLKNFGYAFINLKSFVYVIPFYQQFHGKHWAYTNSEKVCEISYSKIQGKTNLVNHYPPKQIFFNEHYCQLNQYNQFNQFNSINFYSKTVQSGIAYRYNNERFFGFPQSTLLFC